MHSRPTYLFLLFCLSTALIEGQASAADAAPAGGSPAGGAGSVEAGAPAGAAVSSPLSQPEQPAVADATPSQPETATSDTGLFEQSVSATSGAGESDSKAAPFKLSGYVRGALWAGKMRGARDGETKADYGEASLIVRTPKTAYGDGFAEVRLRYGTQGGERLSPVDVREAYANAYFGPLDLRIGKQIIVWGRADAFNPTNNLMPADMRVRSPVEDDRRLGNVAARGFLRLGHMRLEGVWIPTYIPSELPAVVVPQYAEFGTPVLPGPKLQNGLAAGRLHLERASFEVSVSYVHGYAPLPGLTLANLTIDPATPQIVVARTAYKHQVVGFDFSTAIGDLLAIRGELAYRRPYEFQERSYVPRPDLQYVLGVDRTFGSVSVIAQYMGRYAFSWQKETGPAMDVNPAVLKREDNDPVFRRNAVDMVNLYLAKTNQILFNQTERVQHSATVRVEWLTAHDTLSLSALGMVNLSTKEWLLTPKVGYRASDSVSLYLGAEILTGPRDTLFSLVDETLSAGYLELRCTF